MVRIKIALIVMVTLVLFIVTFLLSKFLLPETATLIQQLLMPVGVVISSISIVGLGFKPVHNTQQVSKQTKKAAPNHKTVAELDSNISTLYVGNLPYRANEMMVKEHFEAFGFVQSVRLMKDKRTGKRKGFGFVEVGSKDADTIIEKLNDSEFEDRTIKVRPAKDKSE